jgi:hypothetical protein
MRSRGSTEPRDAVLGTLEAWLPQPQAANARARTATTDGAANRPGAGRAAPFAGRASRILRIAHRPDENTKTAK